MKLKQQYLPGLKYKSWHRKKNCPFGGCENCACIICKVPIDYDRKNQLPLCKDHKNERIMGNNKKKTKETKETKETKIHKECSSECSECTRPKKKLRLTCPRHTVGWTIDDIDELTLSEKTVECCVCRNKNFIVVSHEFYKKTQEKEPNIIQWFNGVW